MPNKDLKNNFYKIPNNVINYLNKVSFNYKNNDSIKGIKKLNNFLEKGELSYQQMKNLKSYFDNNDSNDDNYDLNGGDIMANWVNKELKTSRDAIHQVKKTRMKTGEENQFKKTHTKDRDNTNVGKVRIPKISKSSKIDNILSNKVTYENIYNDIDNINYLIEYFNNKENKI